METARRLVLLIFLAGALSAARAQTNGPDATPAPPPPPPAPALTPAAESDLFFERFKIAEQLAQKGNLQEAAFAMDLLAKTLTTSPWLEIAMFKHTQLIEPKNPQAALEAYTLLHRRVDNSPYYQGSKERAAVFAVALRNAIERGVSRVRIYQLRDGLGRYFARYQQYPESLAKLAIFGYVEMDVIRDYNGRPFRYIPTGQRIMPPAISYMTYELEPVVGEPFSVSTPRLEGTSLLSDNPPKYAALIRAPGRADPLRIQEDQTVDGVFIAAIAAHGAVGCTQDRLLVLPVR